MAVVVTNSIEESAPIEVAAENVAPIETPENNENVTETPQEEEHEELKDLDAPKEKKGRLQQRFSELTSQRKEAEAKAQAEAEAARLAKEELARAKAEAEELRKKYESPKELPEPKVEDYTDAQKYAADLKAYIESKVRVEEAKKAEEQKVKVREEQIAKSWGEKWNASAKEVADFNEVMNSTSVVVSDQAKEAIRTADNGPMIVYHLGKSPSDLQKMNGMSVPEMLKFVGRLDAKYDKPAQQEQKPAENNLLSKAPAPIKPVKNTSAALVGAFDDNGNFQGSMAEYKRLRAEGKIK